MIRTIAAAALVALLGLAGLLVWIGNVIFDAAHFEEGPAQ